MARRSLIVAALALLAAACGTDAPVGEEASAAVDDVVTTTTTTTTTTPPSSTTTGAPTTTAEASTTTVARSCIRVTDFDDTGWFIVNDGVMGGRSDAQGLIEDGTLTWTGTIVTAGGGFSSIRGPVDGELDGATSLTLRVRTDGRRYELLADDALDGRTRVTHYNPIDVVGEEWQEVSVPLTAMEARVFGNPVTADPFAPELATQIGVILADGLDGEFTFEIDWIDACSA